jgi:VIT family/YegS C-terminal NAD kinase beta sandwich-like domain
MRDPARAVVLPLRWCQLAGSPRWGAWPTSPPQPGDARPAAVPVRVALRGHEREPGARPSVGDQRAAFGGPLRLGVPVADLDDRLLDIVTVDDIPPSRVLLAAVPFLLRSTRPVPGISIRQAAGVQVRAGEPLVVTLDGEIVGTLPGSFDVAGDALRVIVPPGFTDIDDIPAKGTRDRGPSGSCRVLAGLFASALAMASGEYVSVSSQRDSERAMLALERQGLAESPLAEAAELTRLYEGKGLARAGQGGRRAADRA